MPLTATGAEPATWPLNTMLALPNGRQGENSLGCTHTVVRHGINIRMFVVVGKVDVLEGVEENAETIPLVFTTKHRTLNVVMSLDQPDGEAIAIQVLGGSRGT